MFERVLRQDDVEIVLGNRPDISVTKFANRFEVRIISPHFLAGESDAPLIDLDAQNFGRALLGYIDTTI